MFSVHRPSWWFHLGQEQDTSGFIRIPEANLGTYEYMWNIGESWWEQFNHWQLDQSSDIDRIIPPYLDTTSVWHVSETVSKYKRLLFRRESNCKDKSCNDMNKKLFIKKSNPPTFFVVFEAKYEHCLKNHTPFNESLFLFVDITSQRGNTCILVDGEYY